MSSTPSPRIAGGAVGIFGRGLCVIVYAKASLSRVSTFGSDGIIAATLPGGIKRQGRWSVDSSGHLVSDVTGGEGAVDASVHGDTLTVALEGHRLALRRESSRPSS